MNQIVTIEDLNQTSFERFIESVNVLFETAPPLGNRLYKRKPYASYDALIDEAEKICATDELTKEERVEVMNAHPRIGAAQKSLSAMSQREQGKGNEDEQVNEQLGRLNEEYEKKYGFKFVIFVNGRSRKDIIPHMKERISNSTKERELEVGIRDMMLIARDRLKKVTFIESRL
ncbi:Oxo-4-hydroxy-4-carboxy-5-ureidoimidazoline decarboxylase [Sporodiniella umbellata]|nr:Oxo-4-hydroxy-4-carboxy-5-ureidoimidazoline decarboxylase [Sporodiniella umbellata]